MLRDKTTLISSKTLHLTQRTIDFVGPELTTNILDPNIFWPWGCKVFHAHNAKFSSSEGSGSSWSLGLGLVCFVLFFCPFTNRRFIVCLHFFTPVLLFFSPHACFIGVSVRTSDCPLPVGRFSWSFFGEWMECRLELELRVPVESPPDGSSKSEKRLGLPGQLERRLGLSG